MSHFHPLEVVDRGSETQLQVGGNLKKETKRLSVMPTLPHAMCLLGGLL